MSLPGVHLSTWDKINHVLWVPKLHPFLARESIIRSHLRPWLPPSHERTCSTVQVVSIDNDEEVVSYMKAVLSRKGQGFAVFKPHYVEDVLGSMR